MRWSRPVKVFQDLRLSFMYSGEKAFLSLKTQKTSLLETAKVSKSFTNDLKKKTIKIKIKNNNKKTPI